MRDKLRVWFTVTARVVFRGATLEVEACSAEEARKAVEEDFGCPLDFDLSCAEMVDWEITDVREEK